MLFTCHCAFETQSTPWLLYATATTYVSPRLAPYGSYTQGLEESGTAPNRAITRGEPGPAIRIKQLDAGLRYTLAPKLKLIVGVFRQTKPYFRLDAASRFVPLGSIRNHGIELSLAAALTDRIDIVTGAVVLNPRVASDAASLGRAGPIRHLP